MTPKFFFLMVCLISSFMVKAQTPVRYDSTLIKFVKQVYSELYPKRVQTPIILPAERIACPPLIPKPDFVFIGSESIGMDSLLYKYKEVKVDSLYKYKIRDFSRITVHFDFPPAFFGSRSQQGIISLQRKDSAVKKETLIN